MNAPGNVVQAWLRRARSDLELARIALEARSVLPEDACFHAQQCAEKALKAFLLQAGDDPPRTHAIDVLLDRLKVRGIFLIALTVLSPYPNMPCKPVIPASGSR